MLTGGELLLYEDVGAIVQMTKARRHLVGISTNGLLLPEHVGDLRAAGLDVANVSVYDERRYPDVAISWPAVDGTRRGLLARDARVPPLCAGCYTLDDPWRHDI